MLTTSLFLIPGPATPQRVHPGLDAAFPLQAEGARAAGASDAVDPSVPQAPTLVCAPQRCPCHLHHLQVSSELFYIPIHLKCVLLLEFQCKIQ